MMCKGDFIMSTEQSKRFITVLLRPSTLEDLEKMLSENFSEFTKNCIREEIAKRKGCVCSV